MVMIILTEVIVIMVMVDYDYILNTVRYDKSANMEDGLAVTSNKSLTRRLSTVNLGSFLLTSQFHSFTHSN